MIPEGYYTAIPTKVHVTSDEDAWAQIGKAATGNYQIVIHFTITEGNYKGHRLPWFGSLSKDAAERTVKSLRLVGFTSEDLSTLPTTELKGEVQVQVEHNVWEGKVRPRIAWVNEPGGPIMKMTNHASPKEMRDLSAKLRNILKVSDAPSGQTA